MGHTISSHRYHHNPAILTPLHFYKLPKCQTNAMKVGKALEDIAAEEANAIDYDGLSGFQYGLVIAFLAKFWKHGEQLRRWHNLRTQNPEEGEQANAEGGVLNPAVIKFGKK